MISLHIYELRAVYPNTPPEMQIEHWGCQTAANARARELSKKGWTVEVSLETVEIEEAA